MSMGILERVLSRGFTVVTADEVSKLGLPNVLERMRQIVRSPLHVSLDIDSIDPAFAPATGLPEPGGLTSREILELVHSLKGLPAVCFDLMEVSPPYDHAEITSILAANIVYEFLLTRV